MRRRRRRLLHIDGVGCNWRRRQGGGRWRRRLVRAAVAPAVVGIAMVGIEHRRNVKLREARKQRIKDRTTGVEHLRRGSSDLTEVKVEEEAAAAGSKREEAAAAARSEREEEAAAASKREEAVVEVKVADEVPPATLPPRSSSASLAI